MPVDERIIHITTENQARSIPEQRIDHVEVRALDDSDGIITGRAAPFNKWTAVPGGYLERFVAETFETSVMRGEGAKAPLLTQHDYSEFPIGRALEWGIKEDGLYGTWQIDMKSERSAEVYRLAKEGYLTGLSVGFVPDKDQDQPDFDSEVPRVTRYNAKLREVSVVSVAAYPDAQITMSRSAGLQRIVDPRIAQIRKEMGLKE